jgi:hypothetical protein
MRSRTILTVGAMLTLTSCVDRISAPNTDVGLTVWATAAPAMLSARDTSIPIHLRVYVGNPSSDEVSVPSGGPPYHFTRDPAPNSGLWGSLRIGTDAEPLNAGPNIDWWGQSVYTFAPRSITFDENVITLAEWKRRGWSTAPGRYRVRGWFNGREGKEGMLIITP